MENDAETESGTVKSCPAACTNDINDAVNEGPAALNSTILNYYKKFGRKRDLEQYFSLSTAQSDIRDPTSLFWMRIKAMSDSSDSGEKRSESPTELCRISIKCTNLESPSSQENVKAKSDSDSPPIITEDVEAGTSKHSDDGSIKSDDNMSQKSMDATLDTSMNKLLSPSSSITSQRKLEWDSLADVGYANETDNKNSASSLSTLERLALKQHCSNNDGQNPNIGLPTAHSTPQDENDSKFKGKTVSKTTKIFRKDTDVFQVNMLHSSDLNKQAINVNLTKHISFNMDGDQRIIKDVVKDVSRNPDTIPGQEEEENNKIRIDKESQTTLPIQKEKSSSSIEMSKSVVPVLINLNTLRQRRRRKKVHHKKITPRIKRKEANKENTPVQEKSGEQVSEAESFEYMPGHIYNQNQMNKHESNSKASADNKSSLESSGNFTTDSSKGSTHSFTKDLQKSLNLLRATLNKRYDNSNLKRKLIKEVVQRLLKSSYRDDESTTDFLSGLSFGSVKLGMSEATTTSTSEGNTTEKQPKKSILRQDKFNSSFVTSASQSAPNLPLVTNSENPVSATLRKLSSNTESDVSSREKISSNTAFHKSTSEELYKKYLDALKREQAYKRRLRDKEMFLKQKLVCSDTAIKMPVQLDTKVQTKLKDLMKDLTRNNYDDGSGDASKLEGGSNSNYEPKHHGVRKQRSHSVFTLSSGEFQCSNSKDSSQKTAKENISGPSKNDHYSCYPSHTEGKACAKESSTQVNLINDENGGLSSKKCSKPTHYVSDSATGDIKYVCFCPENVNPENVSEKILVYKCSRLTTKTTIIPEQIEKACIAAHLYDNDAVLPGPFNKSDDNRSAKIRSCTDDFNKPSKFSQTNLAKLFNDDSSKKATSYAVLKEDNKTDDTEVYYIHEATRQLQTELSINPRISDPSLCDIKIIGNTECAKLITEQYRQISKSSLGKTSSETMVKALNLGSEESDGTSVASEMKANTICSRKMKYVKSSEEDYQSDFENIREPLASQEIRNNLTIPIEGTNMTLMVKIGKKPHKPGQDECAGAQQAPKTSPHAPHGHLITYHESFGDNSKSHHVNTLFAQHDSNLATNDPPSSTSKNVDKGCGIQNELLDDFFATDSQKVMEYGKSSSTLHDKRESVCNTYPKLQPKLLYCSNTDTNNLRKKFDCQDRCVCGQVCKLEGKQPLNTVTETAKVWRSFQPIKYMPKNLPEKLFCPCPEPVVCGNRCDETVDCFENRRKTNECKSNSPQLLDMPHSSRNSPTKMPCSGEQEPLETRSGAKQQSYVQEPIAPPQRQFLKKPECPCPETALCDRTCDETADCFQNAPKNSAKHYGRTQEHAATAQKQCLKKPECPCPETAVCGKICDETAECFQNAPRTSSRRYSSTQEPAEFAQKELLKKLECPCPEMAVCGRNCDKTAECFQKETKSDAQPLSGREAVGPAQRECFKKPECPCPETAVCGKTCDETAECYPRNPLSPKSEKYNFMQTQPLEIRNVDLRKESVTSSTNTDSTHHNDIKYLSSSDDKTQSSKKSNVIDYPELETSRNFIIELINDITKRYTKKDIHKNQRKKCFDEIMKILNYLLDTEDPDPDVLKTIQDATSGATDSEQEIKNKIVFRCNTGHVISPENAVASSSKAKSSAVASNSKVQDNDNQKPEKKYVDKGIQQCSKKCRPARTCCTESSEVTVSSECACTSSDVPTRKVLDKIRRECDKYHQKRCKYSHSSSKCETSSSTTVNCEKCKRSHHCHCRLHKCKSRPKLVVDKVKKKCVAYNLILQTSESMISEEASFNEGRPLRNIIVKVPPKQKLCNMPFKEVEAKIEKHLESPRLVGPFQRSRSCPNEGATSNDEATQVNVYSIKKYLEQNRPDFLEHASKRQHCLKMISERRNQDPCAPPRLKMVVVHPNAHGNFAGCSQPVTMYCEGVPLPAQCTCTDPYNMHMMQKQVTRIAKDREIQRELLSMQLQLQFDGQPPLSALSETDLRQLARDLGADMRRKQEAPKFISERAMKKHSEKIYKSLPEVVRKKEELKKERIKKTNLLMASIFNKNLQKKTLRGAVNLSNYSNVVKI